MLNYVEKEGKRAIVASIFLDLAIASRVNSLRAVYFTRYPKEPKNTPSGEIVKKIFESASKDDAELRIRHSEVLELQRKRYDIYSFTGCLDDTLLGCKPEVTCPTGGTPPCCSSQFASDLNLMYDKILLEGVLVRDFFKAIVFWGDQTSIEAIDKDNKIISGDASIIGVVDSTIISVIDFSNDIDDIVYIKINNPDVLIQVP